MRTPLPTIRAGLTAIILTAASIAGLAALLPAFTLAQSGGQGGDGCADLLAYYHSAARSPAIVYDDFGDDAIVEAEVAEADGAADSVSLPQSGGGGAVSSPPTDLGARSETGTNVQVAGVDESDIVKTNGSEIFVLRENALVVVSVREDPPRVIGGLRFDSTIAPPAWGPREMLLAGERLLIFRSVSYGYGRFAQDGTQLLELDVSAPARPRVLRTLDAYGNFVTARLVGNGVRAVLNHDGINSPYLAWSESDWEPRPPGEDERRWRERVERSTLATWLPLYSLTDHTDGSWRWGRLAPCAGIQTPEPDPSPQSGTETTVLLSFDLADGLGEWDAAGVIGATSAVYASAGAIYAATVDWPTWWSANTTIHRWALSASGALRYQGAAEVEGWLINQFALSEFDGKLRVASTDENEWPISSRLTIFEIGEDGLRELSKLDGLGPSERIYAVRFLGELAYVVTFRLIDPLYVLDLSNPAEPKLAGELKIPGFSSYLHPLGGGLLLGVGQNADPRTGQPLGLQVSLFDVSDPSSPTRLDQVDLSSRSRDASFEHRAFTYHAGRAYIPASPTNELFAVRVTQDGLELEQQITAQAPVLRTLPIGEHLHLLQEASLATHNLATLDLLSSTNLVPSTRP